MGLFDKLLGTTPEQKLKKIRPIVEKINALEPSMQGLSDQEMRKKTAEFKERLQNGETLDDLLPEAFALVREAAVRTVGMRHFDVQLLGGIVLHQGRIAEMKTGEGKTLVATLPSYLNALKGEGVHIVTVNDYLAKRDAQWMGKIHKFLGLTVGVIVHGLDNDERRAAYNCDITYATNNELGFDYLRDNMVVYREMMVQRELNYAIVDEVDSILIDEARTPLIISGQGEESTDLYRRADQFVRRLTRGPDIEKRTKSEILMDGEQEEGGDYMVDIKAKTVQLTQEGLLAAEKYFNVESLADTANQELNHHVLQALKAHAIFHKDVDYVVQDGQVLIVDEFTGRLMIGRRYSDGLHQALEAKEGVKVERENKTLATITFQNFFRMYKKLAGMTGTAKTEEEEFTGIYNLDVMEIPTNRPLNRKDHNDVVYMTEEGKYRAVIKEIEAVYTTGQPILVGTISVERSELLSEMLKRKGVLHQVLNAKHHAKEAEIVAQAGKLDRVTIATNMAGRGTDILLGGNPDYLAREQLRREELSEELIEEATGHAETDNAEILAARKRYKELYDEYKLETDREHDEVVALGGLHIIGTERHESRRIDNQLRGRAGRQGDPGSTRFYVSLEDELMLRFGADRMSGLMNKLSPDDEYPVEMGMITKQIENAQKRVEALHFETRKSVLRYDDVMNKQREIIYGQRRRVLMGEDLKQYLLDMLDNTLEEIVGHYCTTDLYPEEWDLDGLSADICALIGASKQMLFNEGEIEGLKPAAVNKRIKDIADAAYQKKEESISEKSVDMREIERIVLLKTVDRHWMEHIDAMDQLKQGIGLRAYGQKDPVGAYTTEGFDMFDAMIAAIREETIKSLFRVEVQNAPVKREQLAKPVDTPSPDGNTPARTGKKVGRNDPCPCGSGRKYKNCHGKTA
ncbi:preprotein translocase subunit SecA [Christensenellaceae bacterium OttesenSCG-928-M15]|nr:preprotein translocase subunit SecA [Christensenellaceae bacterium OttesenSCG-928-M15]